MPIVALTIGLILNDIPIWNASVLAVGLIESLIIPDCGHSVILLTPQG